MHKISIITATYNSEKTITDCVTSVKNQTVKPQHLVIDGQSSDDTLQVARLISSDTNIISEPDNGLYDAINKGIKKASGDIIGLMHSDDFFAHDKVLEKVALLFENPNIDGVYGDLDYVAASNTKKIIRHWKSGSYDKTHLKQGWMPPHPTLYLRKEVFEKWGLYDTSFQIAADYDAMLRYLWKGNINLAYLPEVMVKMRVGGASNRSIKHIIRKSQEDYKALRRNGVGGLNTLLRKNISKLQQFIVKAS